MEWPRNDPSFSKENLDGVFVYEPRQNQSVYQFAGDKYTTEQTLEPEKLPSWLEEISARKSESGLAVILASRAELKKGETHNPSILEYLPFSQDGFERIVSVFPLHGDTARLINRSDAAYFNDVNLIDSPERAIFYYCRTSAVYPGDLAVSAVFYPETGYTAAVVFGCSSEIAEEFAIRLDNAEDAWSHPLLLFGILVEIELRRHVDLVRAKLTRLLTRVHVLNKMEDISSTSTISKENYSVDLWIEVSQLRMALQNWKVELEKLFGCISELERQVLKPRSPGFPFTHQLEDSGVVLDKPWQLLAAEAGRRMQKRLGDIVREYDQKIGECTMVLDGMTLSAQLSWSHIGYQDTQANLKIANDTRQDSSQMRSIAFLTMFFLPATFIASLFSTTFFDFNASDPGKILSPYAWVYPVVTIVITAIVVGIWIVFTRRRQLQASEAAALDEKMAV